MEAAIEGLHAVAFKREADKHPMMLGQAKRTIYDEQKDTITCWFDAVDDGMHRELMNLGHSGAWFTLTTPAGSHRVLYVGIASDGGGLTFHFWAPKELQTVEATNGRL
jgi:hypothetical protein